jgi:hypothetical protein
VMTGSLEGCWYTKIDTATDHGAPSGVYHETGREVFVGSLNGGPLRAAARAASRAPPDGRTSRTRSAPGGTSTGGTSSSAERSRPRSVVTTGRGKPPPHHVHRVANPLTCHYPCFGLSQIS